MLADMDDERKFDAIDASETTRKRMHIKISGTSFMEIPLNIVRIRVNDIGFTDIVVSIDFEHYFEINLNAVINIKIYFSPADIKFIIKIIFYYVNN